ncbi:MAG: sugar phosphate isomerase/epimerase family protein, partial [Bryobacteraceae bacterium]
GCPMNIRLANAPVSWGIMEVEGWSPSLAAAQFLDELKRAGYAGTELGPYGFLPTDPAVLGEMLRVRGLALISAFVPLRLKEPRADLEPVRQVAALLQPLDAKHIVLADTLSPERASSAERKLGDTEWPIVAANVEAVARLSAKFGLRCVFHHHAGTYIETPEDIARLLELTGIGLCLDTGHYVYGGGDPVEAVRLLGRRVEYLHLKDVHPQRLAEAHARGLSFLDSVRHGVFCPLGEGMVRFPDLFAELERLGYDGWAVVEQDVDSSGGGPTAVECARQSREFLRSRLQEPGSMRCT